MKYLAMIFLIYMFIKSICYGIFEINEKNNKFGGLVVIFLSLIGIILPFTVIFLSY